MEYLDYDEFDEDENEFYDEYDEDEYDEEDDSDTSKDYKIEYFDDHGDESIDGDSDTSIEIICDKTIHQAVLNMFYDELTDAYINLSEEFFEEFSGSYISLPGMPEKYYEDFCDDSDTPVAKDEQKDDIFYASNINIREFCHLYKEGNDTIRMYCLETLAATTNGCLTYCSDFDSIFTTALIAVRKSYPEISYEATILSFNSGEDDSSLVHYKITSK